MTTFWRQACMAATMFLLAALTGPAQAQEVAGATSAPAERSQLFDGEALDESALARISGREDTVIWQTAVATSNAKVENNQVGDHSPTGALTVSDAAFQNVSGISMVNLNTGNASSINATLNVNLTITMAPPLAASGR